MVAVAVTSVAAEPIGKKDDLGDGAVELVQSASITVMATVAIAPSLRTMGIMATDRHRQGRGIRCACAQTTTRTLNAASPTCILSMWDRKEPVPVKPRRRGARPPMSEAGDG
jgi:hypothetical protein